MSASERQLRRRASQSGLRLIKLRETNRDYWQYGPYMLVDVESRGAVASGLDLGMVEDELTGAR